MAKEYFIGDFLKRIKRPITLNDNQDYNLVTIKMNHNGVVLRGKKKGSEIKSNMYEVKEGDFILSGIDARNGAFGIVPSELDGAIVTNDFWYFEIDENIISKRLFLELTATAWFDEICKRGSDGTTQRIRLQKNKFFNQSVLLPEGNMQKELLDKIISIKSGQSKLDSEIQTQKQLLSQLKQSILQEAIQGKLTADWRERHPELVSGSNTANELLKRIKAEKAQLIKDKKIKKEKALPQIAAGDIPFELPEGWVWCRFMDIVDFQLGKTPASKQLSFWSNGSYNWLNIKDMVSNGFVAKTSKKITKKAVDEVFKTQKIVPENTLLMSFKLTVGKVSINTIPLYHNEAIISIFPFAGISKALLFKVLPIVTDLSASKKVLMGQTFNSSSLSTMLFPLPPYEEQRVIEEKAKSLMQKCQALESEITQSEQHAQLLMQAVLKEAFESRKEVVDA